MRWRGTLFAELRRFSTDLNCIYAVFLFVKPEFFLGFLAMGCTQSFELEQRLSPSARVTPHVAVVPLNRNERLALKQLSGPNYAGRSFGKDSRYSEKKPVFNCPPTALRDVSIHNLISALKKSALKRDPSVCLVASRAFSAALEQLYYDSQSASPHGLRSYAFFLMQCLIEHSAGLGHPVLHFEHSVNYFVGSCNTLRSVSGNVGLLALCRYAPPLADKLVCTAVQTESRELLELIVLSKDACLEVASVVSRQLFENLTRALEFAQTRLAMCLSQENGSAPVTAAPERRGVRVEEVLLAT